MLKSIESKLHPGNYQSNTGKLIEVTRFNGKHGFNLIRGANSYGPFNAVSISDNVYILAGGLIVIQISDSTIKLEDLGEFEDYYKMTN